MIIPALKHLKYTETKNGILYQADCLDVIRHMPDNSIDLVLTDPPYGENVSYGRGAKKIANNETPLINKLFLEAIYPKIRMDRSIYIFTNWKTFSHLEKYAIDANYAINNLLCIVKKRIGMGASFRPQFELCLVLEKGNGIFKDMDFSTVQEMAFINHDKDSHPHEKAISLLTRILRHSSNADSVVFDGFAGSGSVPVACESLGRKWIGVELDEQYWRMSKERIDAEAAQIKLF